MKILAQIYSNKVIHKVMITNRTFTYDEVEFELPVRCKMGFMDGWFKVGW
jgi:hypothetical protein